jgi:4'-phosphopantetheinyl transferase
LTADAALLDRHDVDLWYVRCDDIADPCLLDEYRALLPQQEVQRADKFIKEKDRRQFLVAWMLVRTALSYYTGENPRHWMFVRTERGKPSVSSPPTSLHFNLSHTSGLVVCAVARCELGVDAEEVNRSVEHLQLAQHFFAPAEVALLEELGPDPQRTMFFRLWTLKESLLKARGTGLSVPLVEVAFSLAADRPPRVALGGTLTDQPGDWQFAELSLEPRWRVALAVPLPATAKFSLRLREALPLRWQRDARTMPANAANLWAV